MFFINKILLISILLSILACAHTGKSEYQTNSVTVQVTGVGLTRAEAQKSGFRDAIQQVYGSLTLSERRVTNDKLFEDDVSYARGVIESYEILSTAINPKDKLYTLGMRVTVSPSTIQRRLLDSQDASNIDGGKLGIQIANGQAQSASEIERYMQARRLFEHISRDLGRSIFDIKNGELRTERDGVRVSTSIETLVSVNKKTLQDLCFAATEYHNSRGPSVPENLKTNLRSLQINHAYNCFINSEIESVHFDAIISSLRDAGICLDFIDKAGTIFYKTFYKVKLVDDGIAAAGEPPPGYANGYRCGGGGSCVYGPRNVGVSSFDSNGMNNWSPNVIRITRLAWGNDISFVLNLPDLDRNTALKINKINSRITKSNSCKAN